MAAGRDHAERRTAQAAAARKPENKARAEKYPGKGNRARWKAEIAEPCPACNADAGEPCRPYCVGKAAQDDAEPFQAGDDLEPCD